ncbi:MAG: PHP domain-containing protein [Actinobacteria bacterium]|nr:PHP domain-containing protein [Actinomycetota bacterium]
MDKNQIQNLKLATTLTNLAEIYKQKNESPKAAIDLNIAARTIRDYPGDIFDAYNKGFISSLPAIDETAYKIIEEFFKTGRIKLYDEIKGQYSDELIKFIRISGLGKKTIFKLYELLDLKSMNDLREKVQETGISKLILEKTSLDAEPINEIQIKRLIDSVDYYSSVDGLVPRGFVEFFTESMMNEFDRIKEVKKAVFTGSIRRKKSFIRDIDILLLPEFNAVQYDSIKSEKLLKKLCNLSFINGLIAIDSRPDNISGRFKTTLGIDMEIIITYSKSWSLDLFYTTGSKEHIKKVEKIARQRELFSRNMIQLSPYLSENPAVAQLKPGNNKPEAIASFEDNSDEIIYKMLDLQYIPPELRENNNEIELALNKKLPELIKIQDIKGDLHVHSQWSDGLIDFDEMIEKAKVFGYEYIAISDHSMSNLYGKGLNEEGIIEKIEYVKNLREKTKVLKILMGGEVDIKSVGKLDYDEHILKQMDVVIGSMHSNYTNSYQENTARIVSAIENNNIDLIAHPTGVVFGARAPYSLNMEQIIKSAAAHGKALEINSYFVRLDLNEDYSRKVKENGGKITINTDSHRLNNLDMMKLGVDVARRAGLEKEDVINTMTLEELMKWKNKTARDKR